jgi:hypothetical protein
MSRYNEFVRAYTQPEPIYTDTTTEDILLRVAMCFVDYLECPSGHWCFVYRDRRTGVAHETMEPRPYDAENTLCLRIKTGAQPVEGQPFGIFDYDMRADEGEDGEVTIVMDGPEFSVWRGDVRFGFELDAWFADLMMRVFREKEEAEAEV